MTLPQHGDKCGRESLPLDQLKTICVDDDGNWYRPEYPRYKQELAAPKPFLVPSFDNEVVEVLPSEKQNCKICFDEDVHVMEIENRFQLMESEERDDDESYEIEIVEGNGEGGKDDDADFYLEMIDGEIFYVFETEDDISVEDEGQYDSDHTGNSSVSSSSDSDTQSSYEGGPAVPMQLNIGDMMAPNLDESFTNLDKRTLEVAKNCPAYSDIDAAMPTNDESLKLSPVPALTSRIARTAVPTEDMKLEGKTVADKNGNSSVTSSQIPFGFDVSSSVKHSIAPPGGERESVVMDTPPVSPVCTSGGITSPGTPVSILKPYPPSPTKLKKKDKKTKKDKKEKTFSKTFVRATDFDGEHRVYSWEKPTWTNKALRNTSKGDTIRKGGNLAQPITGAAELIEKGTVKWEKPEWALHDSEHEDTESDMDAKEKLIRKIQDGSMNLPGLQNNKRRLKLSINGSLLAAGGDIVKPITKATIIKKPTNINYIANAKILRATPGGSKLWQGENLAGPVTQATTIKKYDWEKPSWVKPQLHATGVGEKLKSGQDVAAPAANKKNVEWEKPDWAKKNGVGRTNSATVAKKEYSWEKPSWAKTRSEATDDGVKEHERKGSLKATEKGQQARNGEKLEMPITQLPHLLNDSRNTEPSNNITSRHIQRSKSFD